VIGFEKRTYEITVVAQPTATDSMISVGTSVVVVDVI